MLKKLHAKLGRFSPAFRDLGHLDEYRAGFREKNWADRAYLNQIGCLVSIVIVTLGIPLDYIVYPDHFAQFTALRLFEVGFLALMFGLTTLPSMRPHLFRITAIFTGSVIATVCVIIYVTEGAVSPYYAGINLVMIGIGFIMGLTFREAVFYTTFSVMAYLFVSVLAGIPDDAWRIVINNGYFIFLTGVIAILAAYFSYRVRFYSYAQEMQLQKSNEALQEMDRRKSEFIANVSHELRTPVAVIVGPAKHLLQQQANLLPAPARKVLEQIVRNGGRLTKLVNDLLELMVLENTSQTTISYTRLDLAEVLKVCTDQLAPLFGRDNHRQLSTSWPSYPVWVEGNESQLERVCFNLIQNAYKFTDPDDGRINVELFVENDQAVLRVEDNGVGIGTEHHEIIFQRYRQADGSTSRQSQGTGIGLALVKEIVEAHLGTVSVLSQPGDGATFTLRLPLTENQAGAPAQQPTDNKDLRREAESDYLLNFDTCSAPETTGKAYRSPGKPLIILVEDEPDIASMMLDALKADYDLVWLNEGSTADEHIASHLPHAILLDHMLPGKDGLEVARKLKQDPATSTIPILLITANARDTLKQDALDLGIDEFIAKPFSWVELKARVSNLVRRSDLEKALSERNQELSRAMDDLRRSEAQLIQSERWRSISHLSGALIHEIGNPLNVALSAVRIASKHKNLDIRNEALEEAQIGLERIGNLVGDLKDFLTPENTPVVESVPLHRAVAQAKTLHAERLAKITITEEGLHDTLVFGNKNALIQTIGNLIGNSLDAFDRFKSQNPQISIIASRDTGPGGPVSRLQILDNGPGLPGHLIPTLFEPFNPGPDSSGLGIGLSICQTMVTQMGGQIRLVPSHKGAAFEITLSAAPDQLLTTNPASTKDKQATS